MRASFLYYSLLTFAASAVAYFNAEWGQWLISTWEGLSAWWALAPIGLLIVGILVKAVSQEYLEIEGERDRLQKERTTNEKRTALKDALGNASEEGQRLHADSPTKEAAEKWVNDTADLLEAALGKGEVHLFANAPGITLHSGGNESRQQLFIKGRLHRLSELIARVDRIDLRSDFDPQDWNDQR